MHWAVKYIGMPYKLGGRQPDGVDCWGLVRLIYSHEFRICLPLLPGICEGSLHGVAGSIQKYIGQDWTQVDEPFDGCTVTMSLNEVEHHVGLYADADKGKIIHCWQNHNAIADTFKGLELKGFRTIKFYRHNSWLM